MNKLHALADLAAHLPARPGIVMHSACSEPAGLAAMLAADAPAFTGGTLYSLMPMGHAPYADAPASDHLNITAFFPGKGLRSAVNAGRAKTLRHTLSALPGLFDRNEFHADMVLLQVSPPDAQGRVSLGLSVDYMQAVLRQKPLVVAEINPQLPHTCGDSFLDSACIDYFIDATQPPQTVLSVAGDEIDARIAAHVASLIDDGAVLQVGIGSLPDMVLSRLGHHQHLGLHTGIITAAARPLLEAGVIDNSTKHAYRGVSITTMAAGDQDFYDFLHRNERVEFHPCSFTHGADTLTTIEGLTAINSALQVDLSGRANAETVAGRVVAAPGGLPDFAKGARRAPRGRSILALRASFGAKSNIIAALPDTLPATLVADDMDYVVTEFGIAALRGTPAQRAQALIAIADPAHQAELERQLTQTILQP